MQHVLLHISGGTEFLAWRFHSVSDMAAFRAKYGDDPDNEGAYKDIDDIPVLPDTGDDVFGQRDDHENDTWVLIEGGSIDTIDGLIVPDGPTFG